MRYTQNGKQVRRDGTHFADAADEQAASVIVHALNAIREPVWTPLELPRLRAETFADLAMAATGRGPITDPEELDRAVNVRVTRHDVYQQSDEYACLCGARWDVRDGDEHP